MSDHKYLSTQQQSGVLQSLIDRAYREFKREFPNEEPFWSIRCLRKTHRKAYSKADMTQNWRKIIETKESTTVTPIEEVEVRKARIRKKEIKHLTHQDFKIPEKMNKENKNNMVTKTSVTRKEIVEEIISESKEVILCDQVCYDVDIKFSKEPPIDLRVISIQETKIQDVLIEAWEEQCSITITKDDVTEDVGNVIEHGRRVIDGLNEELRKLKEENIKMAEELSFLREKQKCVVIKELKHIKENWSVEELAQKYSDLQVKLNNLKSRISPTLMKHKPLKFQDLVKTHGFIQSLEHVVKFFDDDYLDEDEIDDID